jgi:hypothetical protein
MLGDEMFDYVRGEYSEVMRLYGYFSCNIVLGSSQNAHID